MGLMFHNHGRYVCFVDIKSSLSCCIYGLGIFFQVAGASSTETDGKLQGDKETSSLKISRGNLLNMLTGKVNKTGKASGASANGVFSQRWCITFFF